tara:strand:- start:162 stop:422 length:261 start_codon:yes stop_codon:yes gene_type:complete
MTEETNSSNSYEKKQNSQWTDRKIGAFWINQTSNGQYLLGSIEIDGKKHPISLYANKFHQENTKRPHYVAYANFSKEEYEEYKSKS